MFIGFKTKFEGLLFVIVPFFKLFWPHLNFLDDNKFKQHIEEVLKRKIGRAKRGRPLKIEKNWEVTVWLILVCHRPLLLNKVGVLLFFLNEKDYYLSPTPFIYWPLLFILTAVESLAKEPQPTNSKKLVGSEHTYRIRINNYRVIYSIENKILLIEVLKVKHRKDVYK